MRKASAFIFFVSFMALFHWACPRNLDPISTPPSPTPVNTTCVNSSGTPCSPTFTDSPTPTSTPTVTPTPTATCPNTPLPTATPNTGNVLNGTVTYTGSLASVDASHLLWVMSYNTSTPSNPLSPSSFNTVATNGGTYHLNFQASGTYYAALFFDWSGVSGSIPVGAPYYLYNNGGACTGPIGNGIAVSGATSGPAFILGDNCRVEGLYGTVQYTGSKGPVNPCHPLYVQAFSDSGYSSRVSVTPALSANGSRYDLYNPYQFIPFSSLPSAYIQAFYDAAGTGSLATGDPYINLTGSTTFNAFTNQNISFNDSTIK